LILNKEGFEKRILDILENMKNDNLLNNTNKNLRDSQNLKIKTKNQKL